MKWTQLSNDQLMQELSSLSQIERQTTARVIECLCEVDRRQLHLRMGFPSLYAYLTEKLGYSNGSAYRRIEAVRMARAVPDLIQDLETGEINLMHVTTVSRAVRQKEKTSAGTRLSTEEKSQLLKEVRGLSTPQTETKVAKLLDVTPERDSHLRTQADGSVRIEITLTKEEYETLQRARELLSHSIPDGDWSKILSQSTAEFVERHSPERKRSRGDATSRMGVRREIQKRDGCCQWRDPLTGKVCGSKLFLQIDHIHPRWAGGTDAPENLRILCGAHNRMRYRDGSGVKKFELKQEKTIPTATI